MQLDEERYKENKQILKMKRLKRALCGFWTLTTKIHMRSNILNNVAPEAEVEPEQKLEEFCKFS